MIDPSFSVRFLSSPLMNLSRKKYLTSISTTYPRRGKMTSLKNINNNKRNHSYTENDNYKINSSPNSSPSKTSKANSPSNEPNKLTHAPSQAMTSKNSNHKWTSTTLSSPTTSSTSKQKCSLKKWIRTHSFTRRFSSRN